MAPPKATPKGTTTAQRDFLVTVSDIPYPLATFAGGDKTRTVTKAWNGGQKNPDMIAGPAENGEITVGAPFNPRRDRPILSNMRKYIDTGRVFTVTKQDLDADGNAIGKPKVYSGCLLTSVSEPPAAASSSDAGVYELKFMPQSDA